MLKRVAKIVGYALLWVLLIVVMVGAERLATKNYKEQLVTSTEITIEGGGNNPMIDRDAISWWLKEHNAHPEGCLLDKLDIATIESVVASHNAVAEANVSVTYDGCVEIDIVQREPIARVRVAGYDMYFSRDGYLIPAVGVAPVHVPVVTGSYKPLFGSRYVGYAQDVTRDTIAALDKEILRLEDEKIPHYEGLVANNKALREVIRSAPKKNLFQKEAVYNILKADYQNRLSRAKEAHSQTDRNLRAEIAKLDHKQEEARLMRYKIGMQDSEFRALRDFILTISGDSFWSAEVVQVVVTGGGERPMQLAIIPRSGRFTVDLGTMENLTKKLKTLRRFYNNGLSNVGWNKYRNISLRYDGQVVCR
jgi:hypothetical protein